MKTCMCKAKLTSLVGADSDHHMDATSISGFGHGSPDTMYGRSFQNASVRVYFWMKYTLFKRSY